MTAMVGTMPHPHDPHSASGSSSSHKIKKRAVCLQQQQAFGNNTTVRSMLHGSTVQYGAANGVPPTKSGCALCAAAVQQQQHNVCDDVAPVQYAAATTSEQT
jgi:hypothetical protein